MSTTAKRGMKIGRLLDRICRQPAVDDILRLLEMEESDALRQLFRCADRVCERFMGKGVLCRGIVEFSSFCSRNCAYCGLRRQNRVVQRYRLTDDEILAAVSEIAAQRIKTVVLQSGEDRGIDAKKLARLITVIKRHFGMAVTLSVGERPRSDYALWRAAGADRYLLKIETTDRQLFNTLRGGNGFDRRLACLDNLRSLGYQTGSGIMVGLPGQTLESIAKDILFFRRKRLDMIGIGPFIPHPQTPLGNAARPNALLALKTIALTRIVTPRAHIPATTALGCGRKDFRVDALRSGANVLMMNFTPHPYCARYDIYPGRRTLRRGRDARACINTMSVSAGKCADYSRGDALHGTHP